MNAKSRVLRERKSQSWDVCTEKYWVTIFLLRLLYLNLFEYTGAGVNKMF